MIFLVYIYRSNFLVLIVFCYILAYIHILLISDDAETIDSTLIVNDKRSSQEEAEIMSGALVVNDTDRTHEEAESSGKFYIYVFSFKKIIYTHTQIKPNNVFSICTCLIIFIIIGL